MAVIPGSVCLHWTGSAGRYDATGNAESYVAAWRLETDNALDQGQTVLLYFTQNIVKPQDPYEYGTDTAPSVAIAQRFAADRVENHSRKWEVVVNYDPPNVRNIEARTEAGEPTNDPLEYRPRIQVGSMNFRQPITAAYYVTGYGSTFEGRYPPRGQTGEQKIRPMNSAFTPFATPPMEEDASRNWVMIGKNYAPTVNADGVTYFHNYVNSDAFEFTIRGIKMTFGAGTAKLRQARIVAATENGIDFVQIDFILDAPIERELPFPFEKQRTWDSFELDHGIHARALEGDPDGKGGSVAAGDIKDGQPALRDLLDKDEELISEPVPFDGDGKPLDLTQGGNAPTAVFGQWEHYERTAFLSMQYLQDLIQAPAP